MSNEIAAPAGALCNGVFKFPVRIYYEDTDAGGIVYYANYLKFAERARTEFLRFIGVVSQRDALDSDMCGFVVRHVDIDYRMPARLDDFLTVSCELAEIKGAAATIRQDICRGEDVLAVINIKVVYVSLLKKRPMRIPDDICNKMKNFAETEHAETD